MKVTINGKSKIIEEKQTISSILNSLNIPTPGTAVAINGKIISRDDHAAHMIIEGDVLDIIRPIGGG